MGWDWAGYNGLGWAGLEWNEVGWGGLAWDEVEYRMGCARVRVAAAAPVDVFDLL